MIKNKAIASVCFGMALFLLACYSSKTSFNYDYTYLYDESQKLIKPSFKLFHHSSDSSKLYYQLKSTDILYGRKSGDSILRANIWIKYKLFSDFERNTIIDSATYKLVNYGNNENSKILQGVLTFKAPIGNRYPLEIKFRDQNKDLNVIYQELVDKRDNYNEQYFLLSSNKKILVNSVVRNAATTKIEKSNLIKQDTFEIQLSNVDQAITPPPFANQRIVIEPFNMDTFYTAIFNNNSLNVSSFRHTNRLVPIHSSTEDCFYYFSFYPEYPNVVKVDQMVEPVRYISTASEFKKVINAVDSKKAIDDFWLRLGKTEERTKKMIEVYYGRVEIANQYFTSFREGWKTDRGIIYIVYGRPTTIYKTSTKETWIYGEENNILSVKFEFIKNSDLRSNNAFELVRNVDYKNNWYRAVDMWRQAKIF